MAGDSREVHLSEDGSWIYTSAVNLNWLQEMAGLQVGADFETYERGYSGMHSTKPQTLSYGLTDYPAGTLSTLCMHR